MKNPSKKTLLITAGILITGLFLTTVFSIKITQINKKSAIQKLARSRQEELAATLENFLHSLLEQDTTEAVKYISQNYNTTFEGLLDFIQLDYVPNAGYEIVDSIYTQNTATLLVRFKYAQGFLDREFHMGFSTTWKIQNITAQDNWWTYQNETAGIWFRYPPNLNFNTGPIETSWILSGDDTQPMIFILAGGDVPENIRKFMAPFLDCTTNVCTQVVINNRTFTQSFNAAETALTITTTYDGIPYTLLGLASEAAGLETIKTIYQTVKIK